jgi:pre-mRNA-splicing factor SYF1
MQPNIPVETAIKVYRRYLKIEPTHAEEYIAYLKIKVSYHHTSSVLTSINEIGRF